MKTCAATTVPSQWQPHAASYIHSGHVTENEGVRGAGIKAVTEV